MSKDYMDLKDYFLSLCLNTARFENKIGANAPMRIG